MIVIYKNVNYKVLYFYSPYCVIDLKENVMIRAKSRFVLSALTVIITEDDYALIKATESWLINTDFDYKKGIEKLFSVHDSIPITGNI